MAAGGMTDDAHEGFQTDLALADARMAVFVGSAGIQAVVEVDGTQAVEADDAVKFREHAVEVMDDVIASVPDVAGVKADAEMI